MLAFDPEWLAITRAFNTHMPLGLRQAQYPSDEVQAMLDQTFDIATQGIPVAGRGGLQKDPQWPACLACAVVDRSRRKVGIPRDGVCASCFARYCWS